LGLEKLYLFHLNKAGGNLETRRTDKHDVSVPFDKLSAVPRGFVILDVIEGILSLLVNHDPWQAL
jgi:hypothetical protein